MNKKKLEVIDLFCGIGGLSHGLFREGFNILTGIDFEESCRFGYEYNNKAEFISADIRDIKGEDLSKKYGKKSIKILAGCSPCQPFSNLNVNKNLYLNHEKAIAKSPLDKYASLITEVQPDIITMENVRGLANEEKYPAFKHFLQILKENNYYYSYSVVDSKKYGIPQNRYRLILLASKFGDINLIPYTHENNYLTVKDVISHLPALESGGTNINDRYHKARELSELNMRRIKSMPKDGGNLLSGDSSLITACHRKDTGKSYVQSIYARMRWNEPAPTMTTQCIGIGNGRFGHPEQNRAISLREAAIFQTFPDNYKFESDDKPLLIGKVAKQIGNAVPVRLGEVIGKSIKKHLQEYGKI